MEQIIGFGEVPRVANADRLLELTDAVPEQPGGNERSQQQSQAEDYGDRGNGFLLSGHCPVTRVQDWLC